MHRSRSAVAASLAACSGSEEAATPGGTCIASDLTECAEVAGYAPGVDLVRTDCITDVDTWASDPCPTAGLIGCCEFSWSGVDQRTCFYPDAGRGWDPETWCVSSKWDGVPGVWVDAP
jgi:hypothetical protein